MNKVLKNSWALFLGMGFLMMAYGFQSSLLGVRAVQEEFSLTATGFMMSGYFVGYFIGAATIPNIVSRVGHIRVFAAFASLASLVILIHSILVNPFIWFLLRVLTGISMVCKHGEFQMYYYAHHLGGNRNKRDDYKDHKYYNDTINFCEKYDQNSFDPNYKSLPLEFFRPIVKKIFSRKPYSLL